MRKSHLMVYGSSYDRGLEHLLKMWPDIRKEVPDAELHIFYGWNLFDRVYGDNPERQSWKQKINELMNQPGITHLGRISHEKCVAEHKMAGVWAYPTHFGEISCITAMRAQIYGSVPCVVNYAALKETVQFGVKIEGDIYEPETKELYKNSLIALLKDKKYQEQVRKEMVPWAKNTYSWAKVAEQWNKEFLTKIMPEDKALQLILEDEPILALSLLKKDSELKKKLTKKLAHIFDEKKYLKKYADDKMEWRPENADYERHEWILSEFKGKNLIDLGCYEGSLVKKVKEMGLKSRGVEICKEAVKFNQERGLDVVQGNVQDYKDKEKYDAVVACEVIEHLPKPEKLIETMKNLVSSEGWCYITTPNGCYDPASTLKVWEDEDALIDHVRTYNREKIEKLLAGNDVAVIEKGKELYIKFRPNLYKAVDELMEDNQPLKAWDLVKDTDSPLKDKLWERVKHAFNKKDYKKYYSEKLEEHPVSEEIARDCTKLAPRFKWLIGEIEKKDYKSILDLGCADGYTCLTLALKGRECTGVNLYGPSINIARERASKFGVKAKFIQKDIFDIEGQFDAVVLFEVLEHLPDTKAAIDKCMSLVKKDGSLYLSTPRVDHIGIEQHKAEVGHKRWDEDLSPAGHLRVFTEEELLELTKDYKVKQILVDDERSILMEVSH